MLSPVRPNPILLTVEECIEIAIQNNLGLRINRINDREADINVREDWAQYYPTFSAGVLHTNSAPRSNVPEPATAGTQANGTNESSAGTNSFTGGINQVSPYGTTLDFSVDESRNSFGRQSASAGMGFNLTQPLWQGAGPDVGLKAIRQDRIRRLISRGALELNTQSLIFNVRRSYAEVIRQKQNLDVDNLGVLTAKIFYDLTKARFDAGQVTALDVSNADVQLQNRRLGALQDLQALVAQLDVLKNFMDVDLEENIAIDAPVVHFGDNFEDGISKEIVINKEDGVVSLEIRKNNELVGQPRELFRAERFDESIILEEAIANRIEILNSRRAVAVQKLESAAAKNGLGHQIDLVGGYHRSSAGHSVFEGDNGSEQHNWSYGLNATFPWGNIKNRAEFERQLLELERTEIELKQARTTVQTDVRNIMRNLRVEEQSLLIEALAAEQAKRAAEAAHISFERGLQSSFDVIVAQNNLLLAKRNFINSRLDYLVALAQLELVVGKPTGRINLQGDTVGGLIDAHIPEELRDRGVPQTAPEPAPSPAEDPWNKTREYRKDYKPNRHSPVNGQ